MYSLKTEEERIGFMIALTERANDDGSQENQLFRLTLAYLAEISKIPYEELYSDKLFEVPNIKPVLTSAGVLTVAAKALKNFEEDWEEL